MGGGSLTTRRRSAGRPHTTPTRAGAPRAARGSGAGGPLSPPSTATSVRVRDGRSVVTDGPFAETKEALGGFYLLECKDLDEAIEMAAKIPAAKRGTIEVRPIWDYAAPGSSAG